MATTTINYRSLIDKYQGNCDRIGEIASACETESREMTELERNEYESLSRENEIIRMKMKAADCVRETASPAVTATKILRENVRNNARTEFRLVRDLVTTDIAEAGGIIPVKIQDILDPLQEGLILDKVGLKIQTGLAGDYVWPLYENVEAYILGEGVALTDSPITMDKLTATFERIGVAVPVTRETINQTDGIIEYVVNKAIPQGVATLLNKILFSTSKVEKKTADGTTASATNLVGPFVDCKQTATLDELTFKSLNALKAQVLATGIEGNGLCWVMTKANKATLEATPKDAGSGIMVCENDTICGLPVFTTNFIGEDHIGLGDWTYQAMGMFGNIEFVVDPYSKARQNAVDFVLNANYGTKTLRPEAFLLATINTVEPDSVKTASAKKSE